jgi:hypothetical protein
MSDKDREPPAVAQTLAELKNSLAPGQFLDATLMLRNWTDEAREWVEHLDTVSPYKHDLQADPEVVEAWLAAARELLLKLHEFTGIV